MTLVFTIIALIGLIIFVVGALIHLFAPKTTMGTWPSWNLAIVGLLIWAVASIVLTLDALL